MSFKFNFFEDQPKENSTPNISATKDSATKEAPTENVSTSTEAPTEAEVRDFVYDPSKINLLFQQWVEVPLSSTLNLYYLKNIDHSMQNITASSDLIPRVYEGGFEVWECTIDLLKYLLSNPHTLDHATMVCDLGCGAGLLGIYAMLTSSPPPTVHFQDFNSEVIKNFTMLNYHKNCSTVAEAKVRFTAGDWSSVKLDHYDVILSAETIYSVESQRKVLRVLQAHLKEDGAAFIATKRHYFGVGGGVVDFKQLISDNDAKLKCEVVWTSGQVGLARDILKITRVTSP